MALFPTPKFEGLVIRRTFEEDLENVRNLWSRADVMSFVDFPNGLSKSIADMELSASKWKKAVGSKNFDFCRF